MHNGQSAAKGEKVFWSAEEVAAWGSDQVGRMHTALALLEDVKALAVVPVSAFKVAAIVIDDKGNAYAGVNQEYRAASMAQTVHAEQSALAHAWSCGATLIRHVIVNYPPCGHCRQFINELRHSEQIRIHLPQAQNIPLHTLLPHDFGPVDLDIDVRLLDMTTTASVKNLPVDDGLMCAAIDAAQRSYAPYSGAYAGVALLLKDQSVITGRYAENAAYNPSLPPLQGALNQLHLRGLSYDDVVDGAMARVAGHGQAAHAKALWDTLALPPLRLFALPAAS